MHFLHETFLNYKLETLKNCKEVKHIMIVVIAIIYIFLSYLICDQQWKIAFWKSSGPPENIHFPLFTHFRPKKNSKSASFCLFPDIENFEASPTERVGGSNMWILSWMHMLHWKKVNKYKLKFKTKLGITPALHKPISIKNNLLKKIHNCKRSSNKRKMSNGI